MKEALKTLSKLLLVASPVVGAIYLITHGEREARPVQFEVCTYVGVPNGSGVDAQEFCMYAASELEAGEFILRQATKTGGWWSVRVLKEQR